MKRIVTVHYLFSKRPLIGSKAISWGTNHQYPEIQDVPSHVAVLIDRKWVFESTLKTGVRVIGYNKWKEINTEVSKVPCINKEWEYGTIKTLFKGVKGRKYDWGGILYLGLCLAKQKLFGTPLPLKNKLNDPNKYFCCEVLSKMSKVTYEMETPVSIMVKVEELYKNQK